MNYQSIHGLIFALCSIVSCHAQSVSTLMGARAAALGFASSTLADEWALMNNPAGMAQPKTLSCSFAYEAKPYLPGADRTAMVLTSPLPVGGLGAGVFRFGDHAYSEQLLTIGYANQFGIASLGASASYVQYRTEGFSTKHAIGINFGGIAELTPMLSVGAYMINLNQPKISSTPNDHLPTRMVAGLRFKPSDLVSIITEIEKDLRFRPSVKGGVEYQVVKKLFIRTGFNLFPSNAFGGLGYFARHIKINYAFQFSNILGPAHQLSSTIRMLSKKKER